MNSDFTMLTLGVDAKRRVPQIMEDYGYNYVIAGGYARDRFYGRTPKDMDVWVLNPRVRDVLCLERALRVEFPHDVEFLPMYNSEFGDDNPNTACIEGVFKVQDVDIIITNEKADTTLALLDRFDCNINRFVIGQGMECGRPFYIDVDGVPWPDRGPTEYIQQHETRPARMSKMRNKWEEIQREQAQKDRH